MQGFDLILDVGYRLQYFCVSLWWKIPFANRNLSA